MKTDTADKIIQYIVDRQQATVKELVDHLEISAQAIHRQLKKLVQSRALVKVGRPPRVFYQLPAQHDDSRQVCLNQDINDKLRQHFYTVTPAGEELSGVEGFLYWCNKRGFDPHQYAVNYIELLDKYDAHKKNGFIDGLPKIQSTFDKTFLDELFYLDFYAIERFGKTRLGQILLYAKQSQDKSQIKKLINEIKPSIDRLIDEYAIDGVGFIPPSVKREVQLMSELRHGLNLTTPQLSIIKVKRQIIVPQKTLNKLEDRVENAAKTLVVDEKRSFNRVLLIDDAAGSGATLNETARKLKDRGIAQESVFGFVITGSAKGFDVISEV